MDVCVLIPCYNNPEGLRASLKSIRYDPARCTIVVVDDGSREPVAFDPSQLQFAIHVLRHNTNRGITEALNTGLRWIITHLNPKYIARLDCADTCHAERFTLQARYLDGHPDVGLVGSWCIFRQPSSGLSYNYTTPTGHEDIMKAMHFRNVFIHPTVMFRTSLLNRTGFYPAGYPHVEDYVLFWKMALESRTAILDQFLVTCEINPSGISISNRNAQLQGRYRVVSSFGRGVMRIAGMMKMRLLMMIPYRMILKLKAGSISYKP
ncbi:MAG TPA: glycosyltransferase [Flavisolibacter sp.]|jgi:glycosyltransferase involved in cell wall biosynthesis